jgi:hypothetical protein
MDITDPLYYAVAAFNDATCVLASGNSPLRDRLRVAVGEIASVDLPAGSELAQRILALRDALAGGLDTVDEDDLGTAATEFVGIAVDAAGLLATAEAKADAARP